MQSHHLRVWFANEDLKGGQKLDYQIDQAIRVHDKLILVLSEQGLRSKWVAKEIRKTRKAELDSNRRKFFPIRLVDMDAFDDWECFDPQTGQDLAQEVRDYFIPDFTCWKDHDVFEREFKKLLDALKAVDAPPVPREPPKAPAIPKPQNVDTVIARKKQRLEILEEQQAIYGISAPPEVTIEINELRREIAELGG